MSEIEKESRIVKLISMEDQPVETTIKCAKMCRTINEMMETLGEDHNDDKPLEVPVKSVPLKTLKKIVEWITHWQDAAQPDPEEIKNMPGESINLWDQQFLKMDVADLYDLITASNFLNIPGLLWLTTREVAYMIKGKTAEEIRQTFNIQNDWTSEELEMVQKENQWCEEK